MKLNNVSNKSDTGYQKKEVKPKSQELSQKCDLAKAPSNPDYFRQYQGIAFRGLPIIDSAKDAETTKNVILDGKDAVVKSYKKDDTEYFLTDDGKLYRVRYSKNPEKNAQTVLASKLYNLAGIKTPEMKTLQSGDYTGYISEYMPDLTPVTEDDKSKYYDEFAVDAWLGNWDAFKYGNTMSDNDGNIIKFRTSGTLNYRASGKEKDNFSDTVDEINTFLNPETNPQSAMILQDMTDEDKQKSIERVTSIKKNDIIFAVQQSQVKNKQEMIDKLLKRQESLKGVEVNAGVNVTENNVGNPEVNKEENTEVKTTPTTVEQPPVTTPTSDNGQKDIKPIEWCKVDTSKLPKTEITPEEKQRREECLQKYLSGSWIQANKDDWWFNHCKKEIDTVKKDIQEHPEKRDGYAELASYDFIYDGDIADFTKFDDDRFDTMVKLSSYQKRGYWLPVNKVEDLHKLDDIPLEKIHAIMYGMGLVTVDGILENSNKSLETIKTVTTLESKYNIENKQVVNNIIKFLADETGDIPKYKLDLLDNLMNRDENFKKPYSVQSSGAPISLAASVINACNSKEKADKVINEILPRYEKITKYDSLSKYEIEHLLKPNTDKELTFDTIQFVRDSFSFSQDDKSKKPFEMDWTFEFFYKKIDTREKLNIYKDLVNNGANHDRANDIMNCSFDYKTEKYDYDEIEFGKELLKKDYNPDLFSDLLRRYERARYKYEGEDTREDIKQDIQRIDKVLNMFPKMMSDRIPVGHTDGSYWPDSTRKRPLMQEEIYFLKDMPDEKLSVIKDFAQIETRKYQFTLEELSNFADLPKKKIDNAIKYHLFDAQNEQEFSMGDVMFFANMNDESLEIMNKKGLLKPINIEQEYLGQAYSEKNMLLADLSDEELKKLNERVFNTKREKIDKISGKPYNLTFTATEAIKLARMSDEEYAEVNKLLETHNKNSVFGYVDFKEFKDAKKISDLTNKQKRDLLKTLVKYNTSLFNEDFRSISTAPQFVPANKEEYCKLMQGVVQSIGLKTKPIDEPVKQDFYAALSDIENINSNFMNTDFTKEGLKIDLAYNRGDFMADVGKVLENVPENERAEITNYYGFDLRKYPDGIIRMNGYPVKPNESADINPKNLSALREIGDLVEKFTEGNKIISNESISPELAEDLNKITKAFPELYTIIGKPQHRTHSYTVDIHTLNVLQNIMKNPKYRYLPEKDRKALQIATLFHDLTKLEHTKDENHPAYYDKHPIAVDKTHPSCGAYDAYHIIKKLELPKADRLQIYQIIKNHDFLERYNGANGRDFAFELKDGNNFKMECILTDADLKSVKRDGSFFVRFGDKLEVAERDVSPLVEQLQNTAICMPQTKIPKANQLKVDGNNVREIVSYDKNGKQIKNKVIYLKPNMPLKDIGFSDDVKSDDLNLLVHGLDTDEQSVIFQSLGQIDVDALLSTSYVNYGKGNYHVFRQAGFVLDVASEDINAAYFKDFGSGYGKSFATLKNQYLYNGFRKEMRNYMSDQFKKELNLTDDEYKKLYPKIANKSITQIEEEMPEIADGIRRIFNNMEEGKRSYGRSYNEILVSRPKIQAVFAQSIDGKIEEIPEFLRQYAEDHNVPIIYFGE